MTQGAVPGRKGQPLALMIFLLTGWIGIRACLWEAPFVVPRPPPAVSLQVPRPLPAAPSQVAAMPGAEPIAARPKPAGSVRTVRITALPGAGAPPSSPFLFARPPGATAAFPMFAHGGYLIPAPPGEARLGSSTAGVAARPVTLWRWSADAWVLWRRADPPGGLVAGSPGYGGSQAGAVLRYHLAPGSRHQPELYLRIDGSLGARQGYRTAAAGLAVRPVRRLPVAAMVEGRVVEDAQGRHVRPAVMAVTQLPPQRLPLGVEAELYGQAGYVGGRGATAFYDLQATAERSVVRVPGALDLRLGGGAWTGGQRQVHRLDVGPRISVRTSIAGVSARLSADWRFRVSGRAAPGSGPALTLSAGF